MNFSRLSIFLIAGLLCACTIPSEKETKADKLGWKLSVQSFTFHLFSVVESLEKTKELGLQYIEIYPGQKMGDGFGDAVFGYNLSKGYQNQLKELAGSKGVKIVSSGVWTPKREEWLELFSFAKNMELEFISAEPSREDWDIVESLAKQYEIKVACHNHPDETSYWKPEILLNSIGQRNNLLGSCADIGHFERMGVNPINALTQLSGKIISMHFKDVAPNEETDSLEDVIWGTGVVNIKEMLKELKRQNFKGYFTIEYEADWENNLPQIQKSIKYFEETTDELFPDL